MSLGFNVDEIEVLENKLLSRTSNRESNFNTTQSRYDSYEEPLQLIEFSKKEFKLNPVALEYINSIKEDLIVVSVVGKARTGKSYLMNLLLDQTGKDGGGFKVASTLSSCTKGIWLWGNVKDSFKGNAKILFIDSEGTCSTDNSTKTYDSRIFALVVLISSLFLYNTHSNIDEHGISELSLAAHISTAITTDANVDKDSVLTELAPKFIWIIRDFTLEKVHPETGHEITSKEYLELCLRDKRSGKNSSDNNLIRANIIKYFPDRDCVTLVRPVESEEDIKNLNKIPFSKLKYDFKLEFNKIKEKIYKESLPKKYKGRRLNGPALAQLLTIFVDTINSGAVPNINNTWDSIIQKDIDDYYNKALSAYKLNTTKYKSTIYEQQDLINYLNDAKLESIMLYDKLLQINSDTFTNSVYMSQFMSMKEKLESEIATIETKLVENNIEASSNHCRNIIQQNYKEIEKKMFDNFYTKRTIKDYIEDYSKFANEYHKSAKGVKKMNIFLDFVKEKEKTVVDYLINVYSLENENKLKAIEKDIRGESVVAEDTEDKITNMERLNETYAERIANLNKDIKRQDREVERLHDTLLNMQEELRTVKKSNEQRIRYIEEKKKNDHVDLEDITAKIETRKQRKEAVKNQDGGCKCNCSIF